EVSREQDDVGQAVAFGDFDLMFEDRLAGNLHHGLGQIARKLAHACSFATGENDQLHRKPLSCEAASHAKNTILIGHDDADRPCLKQYRNRLLRALTITMSVRET